MTCMFASPTACRSEQAAVVVLGYTQVTWDNLSGKERVPWSSIKSWAQLSDNEKEAATLLGYNERSWDNVSGSERPPASVDKGFAELTACSKDENPSNPRSLATYPCFSFLLNLFHSGAGGECNWHCLLVSDVGNDTVGVI